MLWKAFQVAVKRELNLEVSILDGERFQRPKDVIGAIRKVLGDRVQLMLHLDETQVGPTLCLCALQKPQLATT